VATYAIHQGDTAVVYDSFTDTGSAQWVRDHLAKAGVRHFMLVNSHWHLDHIGGNAVYADTPRFCERGNPHQAGTQTGRRSKPEPKRDRPRSCPWPCPISA